MPENQLLPLLADRRLPGLHAPGLPEVDRTPPSAQITLPDGSAAMFDGELWPELAYEQANGRMGGSHVPVAVREIARKQVNELLVGWEHPLGAYARPFGEQHFALCVAGQPVACACSSSVRSATVAGGLRRRQVVELARIARHPDHPRSMRAMLRVWTDYLAPLWSQKYPDFQLEAAISYALPGKSANLYRFDGWESLGYTRPWGGSTGWGNASKANEIADGRKKVFLYRYEV